MAGRTFRCMLAGWCRVKKKMLPVPALEDPVAATNSMPSGLMSQDTKGRVSTESLYLKCMCVEVGGVGVGWGGGGGAVTAGVVYCRLLAGMGRGGGGAWQV